MNTRDIISKNICELRKRANLTQAELADKLNYSNKAISKWERGESLPDPEMLEKIATLFNVDINYLFKEHVFSKLSEEQECTLKKKELRIQVLFVITVCTIVLTLLFSLFGSLIELIPEASNYGIYLFIIPLLPISVFLVNLVIGRTKYNIVLLSLAVWTLAIAFYIYFINYRLYVILFIAFIIQIAIIVFPMITVFFKKSEK